MPSEISVAGSNGVTPLPPAPERQRVIARLAPKPAPEKTTENRSAKNTVQHVIVIRFSFRLFIIRFPKFRGNMQLAKSDVNPPLPFSGRRGLFINKTSALELLWQKKGTDERLLNATKKRKC
jgi:hypothetical protein